jgi:hypothetical protein
MCDAKVDAGYPKQSGQGQAQESERLDPVDDDPALVFGCPLIHPSIGLDWIGLEDITDHSRLGLINLPWGVNLPLLHGDPRIEPLNPKGNERS